MGNLGNIGKLFDCGFCYKLSKRSLPVTANDSEVPEKQVVGTCVITSIRILYPQRCKFL